MKALALLEICRWLEVSRSGFYHSRSRAISATAAGRATLATSVRHYFEESDGIYGYHLIHEELADVDAECLPQEPVGQILRQESPVPCHPEPFKSTTTVADAEAAAPTLDLERRDFTAVRPGAKFIGYITYVYKWQGFTDPATVSDCDSKKVVGWAIVAASIARPLF